MLITIFAIYCCMSTIHVLSALSLRSCFYVFKYKYQYVVIELFVTELAGALHATLILSCQPLDGVRAIGNKESLAERS